MEHQDRATEEISRKVELSWLMAYYGGMLTDKQRQVLTLHCEEDLSLGEIAQEAGVSRQGVHDQVKRVDKLLAGYEERLMLVKRFLDLKAKVGRIRETVSECTADNLEEVKKTVAEISDSIMEEL